MIISAKNLVSYLPSIKFPVDVLAEKDDRVLFMLNRVQLMALIANDGVIGVGSRNRVKRIRLSKALGSTGEQIFRESRYSRADQKLTYREGEIENQPYVLKRVGEGGGFEFWSGDEGFRKGRFDPDNIPAPIIPSRALLGDNA